MKEPADFGDLIDETLEKVLKTKWGKAIIAILALTFIATLIIVPIRNQIPSGEGILNKQEIGSMLENTALYRGRQVVDLPIIISYRDDSQQGNEPNVEHNYYAKVDATHEILFKWASTELEVGDCVLLTGTVVELTRTESMFSEEIMPFIQAENVVASTQDIVDPTIWTIQTKKTKTVSGLTVTLHEVVFARNNTRLYVTIENQSNVDVRYETGVLKKAFTRIDEGAYHAVTAKDDRYWEDVASGAKITTTISLPPIWEGLKYHETPDKDKADGWKVNLYFIQPDDPLWMIPLTFHFKIEDK